MAIKCKSGEPRFRFRTTKSGVRQRLVFCGNEVVEVTSFRRRNGTFVKKHRRRT